MTYQYTRVLIFFANPVTFMKPFNLTKLYFAIILLKLNWTFVSQIYTLDSSGTLLFEKLDYGHKSSTCKKKTCKG